MLLSQGKWLSPRRQIKRECGIWQRRFWEHAIRDQNDLEAHVHYNPVKHGWVRRTADWPNSSFYRFLQLGRYFLEWAAPMDIRAWDLE
ncbi:transposase [Methylocaldum szegediense]|uniref:Transposase n=1 Tax=Methylocaldum szegediense TaxID=73780 RepID=A0ABN8WZ96_9GAMM|nr:transposase [Methylocaldum szegediense]